jgi:hypothetical protein
LDTTAPFTKVELIGWTQSDFINDGENENNVMSVRMIGTEITLFANGLKLETIEDGQFATGRFGLFVNAGSPGNYTFDVDELSYWNQ